jgi:hypothetical protein
MKIMGSNLVKLMGWPVCRISLFGIYLNCKLLTKTLKDIGKIMYTPHHIGKIICIHTYLLFTAKVFFFSFQKNLFHDSLAIIDLIGHAYDFSLFLH